MNPEDIKKAIEAAYREGYQKGRIDGVGSAIDVFNRKPMITSEERQAAADSAWKSSQARCFTENGVR